jgi:hypothetical protein
VQDVGPITEAAASRPTPRWVRRLAVVTVVIAIVAGAVTWALGGFELRRDHIMVAVGEDMDAGNLVFTFTDAVAQRTKKGTWRVQTHGTVRNPNDEALAPLMGDSGNLAVSAGTGTLAGVLEDFQLGDTWRRGYVPPGNARLGFAAQFSLGADIELGDTLRCGVFRMEFTDNSVLGVAGAPAWNPDSAARAQTVVVPLTVLPGTAAN